MPSRELTDKVALVTGASRGIGAATALLLAEGGTDVVINYRSKAPRAEEVAAQVESLGRQALLAQADITDAAERSAMAESVRAHFGHLDLLILNASGGMEKDKEAGYALRLNRDAQLATLDALLPLMAPGSRVVFVTSHWAHFYGTYPVAPVYEAVAASKKAGEDALRARIPELAARGIRLTIVSGDGIEGTITVKLLERVQRGALDSSRDLPTIAEFAAAIVASATDDSLPSGHIAFIGSIEP
ncbi:SDR family oxidoreductase [Armatimonas sp.]|uniref:SDR family oxidoreductase n=1 Tax=Armatimonas sp. TaxID=1872638 RepID=UPI003751C2D6